MGLCPVNGWVYKNLNDARRDFKPIALIGMFPLVLVESPGSRFSSLTDLVAYAKGHPGKINYGSGGGERVNWTVVWTSSVAAAS
ncbi:tripartite tricarboxylate transporter substrate-binding protein [Cupriavidus necator]|uniref:tripartite tricarboxylate transporter substrate-binding protein n=1 Tax=Cupriavidus necator TaxID=106590 RepID=UPI003ECDF9BA